MNLLFYRRLVIYSIKAFEGIRRPPVGGFAGVIVLSLIFGACSASLQRVDDKKLAGVPAEKLEAVKEAREKLVMAKADVERAREASAVAGHKLRIMKSALAVAEARARLAEDEFALARFQNDDGKIVAAGEAERRERHAVRMAESDVVVAHARLEAARRYVSALEAKVYWLDAKQELERAKVALRYDTGTPYEKSPVEKSAVLNAFEQSALKAELAFSEAEGGYKQSLVEVEAAVRDRKALDLQQ